MPNPPPPSLKDGQQVLRYAFDDATGSLRTNATLVADSIAIEINASTDNIAIADATSGNSMKVNADGSINVDVATSVLPTGAATSALQTTGNASLASIDSKLTSPITVSVNNFPPDADSLAQGSTTSGQLGSLIMGAVTTAAPTYTTGQTDPLSLTSAGALRTDASATTQPISAVSLPLPSGAATSALQTTGNTSLSSIDGKLNSLGQKTMSASVPVTIASDQSSIQTTLTNRTVTGTIAFSGNQSVTFNCANIATLRLELEGNFGAAAPQPINFQGSTDGTTFHDAWGINDDLLDGNSYNQNQNNNPNFPNGTWKFDVNGFTTFRVIALNPGTGGSSTVTMIGTEAASLITGILSEVAVIGTIKIQDSGGLAINEGQQTMANSLPVVIASNQTAVPISGTVTANAGTNLNTSALALESGGHLASIDTKTPALGQAVAGSSVPVVLTAAQLSTLTPLSSVSVSNFPATQPVSGTVTANIGTTNGLALDATLTGGTQQTKITDGTHLATIKAASTAAAATDTALVVAVSPNNSVAVTGTFFQATQPVSGTVTVNPLTNSSIVKAQLQDNSGTGLTSTGSALDVNLKTSSITLPISAASLPLPSGAATSSLQTTINTTLGSPFQAGGSIGNTSFAATQATAASLNATVVGPSGATLAKDSSLTTINTTLGTPMQNSGGSVTANAGTNLNTSALALESGGNLASIKADTDNLALGQASTTSGQKGNLVLTATTAAAPTYSDTTSNPLSTTTTGALRVDASATTQPVSGTITVNPLTNASIVKAQAQDNAGNGITSTNSALDVNIKSELGTDTSSDVLQSILIELRAMRLALTSLACNGGQANPEDFDPSINSFDNRNFN